MTKEKKSKRGKFFLLAFIGGLAGLVLKRRRRESPEGEWRDFFPRGKKP